MSSNPLLEHALLYASRGWRVFPLHTPVTKDGAVSCSCRTDCGSNIGKHPRIQKWQKDATADDVKILSWWTMWPESNIGLVTGNGLLVIVLENKNNGLENWEELLHAHEKLPHTPESITGGGGKHLLFFSVEKVKNSTGMNNGITPGVDVRGDGGYIVAPPSLHKSGKRYEWEISSDPRDTKLAAVPPWLLALCKKPSASASKPAPGASGDKITEGGRNDKLFSLGRSLRTKGLSHEAIFCSLLAINENDCVPPLDPKEVETIATSVCSAEPGLSEEYQQLKEQAETKRDQPATVADIINRKSPAKKKKIVLIRGDSVEIGSKLICDIADDPTHVVYDRSQMWRYDQDSGIWRHVEGSSLYQKVSLYAGTAIGKDKPLKLKDSDIKAGINAASQFATVKDFFNDAPKGMTFGNGFVAVSGGKIEVHPHSETRRALHRLECDYRPDLIPYGWLKFLDEVFTYADERELILNCKEFVEGKATYEEIETALADDRRARIRFLQEWVGACLMGEITLYATAAVLWGPLASNGKSTFIDVVKSLFPKGSVVSISPYDFENKFYLAELSGARLNAVGELPEKEVMESDKTKSVISGDSIMVARKHQRPFELKPEAGHMFACNTLPPTRDTTDGFWRRHVVIMFDRKFTDKDKEIGLSARLIRTETGGIAAWAIEGLARLQKRGHFDIPASSTDAKRLWQEDSDQVLQWIKECCVTEADKKEELESGGVVRDTAKLRTPSYDAYSSYSFWSRKTGHHAMTAHKFFRRISKHVETTHTKTGNEYHVGISANWIDPAATYRR